MACKEVYGNVKGGWGGGRKIVCKQVKSWKILLLIITITKLSNLIGCQLP